jgi:aminoglycoside phosphotransferase (APT) family kinase protein
VGESQQGQAVVSLPEDIVRWIEDVAGGPIVQAERRPGGARKEAWFVDVRGADGGVDHLFLRLDRSVAAASGDPWTIRREATVYAALGGTDVPVPDLLAVHPTLEAMLSERLAGENWFSRIRDPEEQVRTARDFMASLAALHRIDPATLELPGFPEPTSVAELVDDQLDELERLLALSHREPDPAVRFALRWLRENVPAYAGPIVLVQGDTGPGNFMYADGRVVAIVDWEMAHLGDPMDDIAWLSLRAVQEPFTHLPDRLAEYESLSGHPVDVDRIRYYRVLAETKLQAMFAVHTDRPGAAAAAGGGADVGNALIYRTLHNRLWIEALADVLGLQLRPGDAPPDLPAGEDERLFDVVLGQLRDVVVPRVTDPLALQRTKGVARILKYLAARSRLGPFYAEQELDDIAMLLGKRPATVADGRDAISAAVRAGVVGDVDYLCVLWRRVQRENEVLRAASGVMADRHWPPIQ